MGEAGGSLQSFNVAFSSICLPPIPQQLALKFIWNSGSWEYLQHLSLMEWRWRTVISRFRCDYMAVVTTGSVRVTIQIWRLSLQKWPHAVPGTLSLTRKFTKVARQLTALLLWQKTRVPTRLQFQGSRAFCWFPGRHICNGTPSHRRTSKSNKQPF